MLDASIPPFKSERWKNIRARQLRKPERNDGFNGLVPSTYSYIDGVQQEFFIGTKSAREAEITKN